VIWIHLAQDRNQRLTSVNTIMDFRVPKEPRNFFGQLSDHLLLKNDSPPWSYGKILARRVSSEPKTKASPTSPILNLLWEHGCVIVSQ
jgi:hypothetical protein